MREKIKQQAEVTVAVEKWKAVEKTVEEMHEKTIFVSSGLGGWSATQDEQLMVTN